MAIVSSLHLWSIDNGNFILEHEVGMKNGGIDLGFEDQPDTVTFSEGYQDISRRGITHRAPSICPDCCQERAKQSLLPWCSSHHLHSKLMERSYNVVSKLTDNNLCLFSNNFVATSVVVISTALNSKAPRRTTSGVTIEIQIFEDFKLFNASYVPVFEELQETDSHIYYLSSHNDNGRRQSKFRNPKYLMKCNILQS
ncbi:hypothetical protein YC2023_086988 [Brassica napus]